MTLHNDDDRADALAAWEATGQTLPEQAEDWIALTLDTVLPAYTARKQAEARAEGMDEAFRIAASALREYGPAPVSLAESLREYHRARADVIDPPEATPQRRQEDCDHRTGIESHPINADGSITCGGCGLLLFGQPPLETRADWGNPDSEATT